MNNEEYLQGITKWRQEMDANLRRENGWLALAGLYWLRMGTNLIGSDPNADIVLPGRSPSRLGTFEFDGNNVTLNVEDSVPVEVNGTTAKNVLLDADQEDVPSFITFDDIRMVVVRRSKGVGIRIWDNRREERRSFPSREWYPVKPEFRVPATYTRYDVPKIVKMPDILGAVLDEHVEPLRSTGPVRRAGLMVGFDLWHDPERGERFATDERRAHRAVLLAREEGVVVRPLGDTMVLMPPLSMPDDLLERLVVTVARAVERATED